MNGDFENAIMAQKSHIIDLIDSDKFEDAILLLDFSERLWAASSYAYKTRELRQRLQNALVEKRNHCGHWKQHEKWAKLLSQVKV